MARVLSAAVLIPVLFATVWFLPPVATLVLAEVVAVLAFVEYAGLAAALGTRVPRLITGAAVVAACAALAGGGSADVSVLLCSSAAGIVLLSALIAIGATMVAGAEPGPGLLRDTSAALFAPIYIGLPLGALAAVRAIGGREALVLLAVVIIVSDSAQYYTGRAFGRRLLAPAISPKKTREGALGGLVFGTAAMVAGGLRVFPGVPVWMLALTGATLAVLGMVGDLFESMLKRSAGVKDSSSLIPGHGGVLDRIDSWLFAAPLFYVFVVYLA
ncbi:MAG TPA: phosphatidate cytidylyltransferase [Vicinamibacterales bacterium]|nr:phosphatidate cytidylyltransferase [Vicinamibacterales bacterium]